MKTKRERVIAANVRSSANAIRASIDNGAYNRSSGAIVDAFEEWLTEEPTEVYFAELVAKNLNIEFTDEHRSRCSSNEEAAKYRHEQYGGL